MPLLTQRQAAEMLALSERTLERFRVSGVGPKFVRMGKSVHAHDVSKNFLAHITPKVYPPVKPVKPVKGVKLEIKGREKCWRR